MISNISYTSNGLVYIYASETLIYEIKAISWVIRTETNKTENIVRKRANNGDWGGMNFVLVLAEVVSLPKNQTQSATDQEVL
jgi:hypothetical protein